MTDETTDERLRDLYSRLRRREERLTSLCAALHAPAHSKPGQDLATARARRQTVEICLAFFADETPASSVPRLGQLLLDALNDAQTETAPDLN